MPSLRRFYTLPQDNCFIFGPRGTGKSTWLKQHLKDAYLIDLLDHATYLEHLARPDFITSIVKAHPNIKQFVLDEIQKVLDKINKSIKIHTKEPTVKVSIGKLSMKDKDIIEKTKANVGIDFALTVTAQEARAYKPNLKPFQIALKKLGCGPGDVLHVSSGFRYDIPPARKLGFRTAWVNRKSEERPARQRVDHEFRNLNELADFMETQINK